MRALVASRLTTRRCGAQRSASPGRGRLPSVTEPISPPPAAALRAISDRWGLGATSLAEPPLPSVANRVWFLGDRLVLRVANPHPPSAAALHKEAAIIPLARQAGVRTPRLVAFDPSDELLGAPYLVLERVTADNLGALGQDPQATPDVYRELGRDLAVWHARPTRPPDPLSFLDHDPNPDLRPVLDRLVVSGHLSPEMARWFAAWLDRLAPDGLISVEPRVVHGDVSHRPTS